MINTKTLVIAEAGINHNGKVSNALKLINIAKHSNADFVKFQIFDTEQFINKNFKNKKINFKKIYKRFKKLEFSRKDWNKIVIFAKKKKIKIFFSVFDIKSLSLIKKLNINLVKIPSGEITNLPLLKLVNKFKIKTILSTGMSSLAEIKTAIKVLKNCKVEVLHCVSEYPTNIPNLNKINYLKKILRKKIGFSDHTTSVVTPALAVACGAHIIEKHFTFNKFQKIGDHKISLNPRELSKMIQYIKIADKSKSKIVLKPSKKENELKKLARKGIYYSKDLQAGDVIKEKNIKFLRPLAKSIPAEKYQLILNKKLKKQVKALRAVEKKHLY
tara:strand:- start:85 stop:1071 length:987 start_codon:yes stop_codon:yes gene_type:complete